MPNAMITTDMMPSAQFKILTGTLKAVTGDDGRKRLSGIASSTTKDLHGDSMAQSAIMDMERGANDNLTIFLNHSYDVPEDVFGSVEKATAVQRGADGEGNPNWDLLMDIVVDDDNERAAKTYASIQKGTKLGLSIGAQIPEGGAERDDETGALTINSVILLETSVVSIPANPRSWISNAVKALKKAQATPVPAIEVPVRAVVEVVEETQSLVVDGTPAVEVDTSDTVDSEPTFDIEAGTLPADESVPEEAPVSDPAEDVSTQTEKAAEADEDMTVVATAHVESVSAVLESITAKLEAMTDELLTAKQAQKSAETERDEAVLAATTVVAEVKSILERIGETPVGKKTHFVNARGDFDHLASVYSPQFRQLLELNQGDTK